MPAMSIHCKQKGVALVEFALVLVPLVLMVFGITELGRAFYQYNTLTKSTRNAVRYLTTQTPGSGYGPATCLAVTGYQTCALSDNPLTPGLTAAMVTICDATNCPATHSGIDTGSGSINLVTVSITGFQFTSLIPFVVPTMTFGPIGTTMRQIL
jgi:Flp pilus assembly protein TadG